MIEISNLRKYTHEDLTRLEADINFIDMASPYSERTLYFEIDAKYGDMFADDNYDAFVLVPLYLAMFHKQDLHICGKISKKLYQNMKWYIPQILCDFSADLAPVKVTVDGLTSLKPSGKLIGTGVSCGVDSLATIYDQFVRETDPDYRINALFFFNCGTHGDFGDPLTQKTFMKRFQRDARAANELGLPVFLLDSNLHAFTNKISAQKASYFAGYSCVFSLQSAIRRYYVARACNYQSMKAVGLNPDHNDMATFCDPYLVPLIQTERIELIIDGCQYRRVDKLKNIADWDIARKYLNVCLARTADASNCSVCSKYLRTLLTLEILGKLDDYSNIFDIPKYREVSLDYKIRCLQNYGKDPFETENVDFARENNFPMPTNV